MNDNKFLEIESLSCSYQSITAFKDINLNISKGDYVSIIGSNGAGKSSLLNSIAGIVGNHPNQTIKGNILLENKLNNQLSTQDRLKLGISLVPEGRRIFPYLSVRENLELGAFLNDQNYNDKFDFITELFPILKDRLYQQGGTLSGGEQQMLAIARSLMSNPSLLLLDEPSMGVAPLLVEKIFETLAFLNKKGTTIMVVEQNAKIALKYSNYGFIIDQGTIISQGIANQLINDPIITKSYLG